MVNVVLEDIVPLVEPILRQDLDSEVRQSLNDYLDVLSVLGLEAKRCCTRSPWFNVFGAALRLRGTKCCIVSTESNSIVAIQQC